jgi:hypothetical protein
MFFSTQTDEGIALIKKTRDIFVPYKQVSINVEGNIEITDVIFQEGKEAEYVIYIDEEKYKFTRGEKSDVITTKEPLEEKYPEVSMTIEQFKHKSPQEMLDILETKLAVEYTKISVTESVTEPVEGFTLHGISGSKWNSPVTNVYVIDNKNGGSFVITEKYFLEASEGHGARFNSMLKQFKIIE